LTAVGVDHVLVEGDEGELPAVWPDGPDFILELVGARTAADSLRLVRPGGTVCVAGSLSGWALPDFEPIAMIPTGTRLTAFHSDTMKGAAGAPVLQRVVREVEGGVHRPTIDRVFRLDDIAAAHHYMENSEATGKLVLIP
jgi:NADPH:quinone reductase-like Zn-dependent oxidoreductase